MGSLIHFQVTYQSYLTFIIDSFLVGTLQSLEEKNYLKFRTFLWVPQYNGQYTRFWYISQDIP